MNFCAASTMGVRIVLLVISSLFVDTKASYTTKYDNIDIDEVIKNERLVKRYVECLLDKGACPPDGFELKQNMPDAITTNCESCSEKQRIGSEKFIAFLIDEKPEFWTPLQAKYDPSGNYTRTYLASKNTNNVDDSNNNSSGENQNSSSSELNGKSNEK